MNTIELLAIAVGLSMDAFAVSVCIGLSDNKKGSLSKALTAGLYFGFFQAIMPVIGFFLSSRFADSIEAFDHWIAFVLLSFIGGKMIWESLSGDDDKPQDASTDISKMLTLAIATSIDALAVGISFAFLKVDIIPASIFIGVTTLLLSMLGVKMGSVFGIKFKSRAEIAGGCILILMGIKILLEHLGVFTL